MNHRGNVSLAETFKIFHDFYREGSFTDCELRCSDDSGAVDKAFSINVHRLVLAAASKKLRGILSSVEQTDSECVIHVAGFDSSTVKSAINLVYEVLAGYSGCDNVGSRESEVLAFLGIQFVTAKPKVLRKATPEEIARIKASLVARKGGNFKTIKIVPMSGTKRPAREIGEFWLLEGLTFYQSINLKQGHEFLFSSDERT